MDARATGSDTRPAQGSVSRGCRLMGETRDAVQLGDERADADSCDRDHDEHGGSRRVEAVDVQARRDAEGSDMGKDDAEEAADDEGDSPTPKVPAATTSLTRRVTSGLGSCVVPAGRRRRRRQAAAPSPGRRWHGGRRSALRRVGRQAARRQAPPILIPAPLPLPGRTGHGTRRRSRSAPRSPPRARPRTDLLRLTRISE